MTRRGIKVLEAKIYIESGMTQAQAAEVLGVTPRTIRNYLRGHREGGLERVRKRRPTKLDAFRDTEPRRVYRRL